MTTLPNHIQPTSSPGAALYVDTENLRDAEHARHQVVAAVVAEPGPATVRRSAQPGPFMTTRRQGGAVAAVG